METDIQLIQERREKRQGDDKLWDLTCAHVPGFHEAVLSYKNAMERLEYCQLVKHPFCETLPTKEQQREELFLSTVSEAPHLLMPGNESIVSQKMKNADTKFFRKLGKKLTTSISNSGGPPLVSVLTVSFWLSDFLWLMSDKVACKYLSEISSTTFELDTYRKTRNKWKLKSYYGFSRKKKPIITGFSNDLTEFKFCKEWKFLDPKNSGE